MESVGIEPTTSNLIVATLPTELQFHKCGGGDSTVIKGVGELRYNTFTSTRSNACFLVGIRIVYTMFSQCQPPFSTQNNQNTNIFIFLHQKQDKSVEITPNKQETPKD